VGGKIRAFTLVELLVVIAIIGHYFWPKRVHKVLKESMKSALKERNVDNPRF